MSIALELAEREKRIEVYMYVQDLEVRSQIGPRRQILCSLKA